jgi:hypothetical protein
VAVGGLGGLLLAANFYLSRRKLVGDPLPMTGKTILLCARFARRPFGYSTFQAS